MHGVEWGKIRRCLTPKDYLSLLGEIPQLPYIVYLYPESDNFGADDGVYFKTDNLQIELYESKRDFAAESILESVLDDAELFYEKTEVWIEEDRVYEIIYELEMM